MGVLSIMFHTLVVCLLVCSLRVCFRWPEHILGNRSTDRSNSLLTHSNKSKVTQSKQILFTPEFGGLGE